MIPELGDLHTQVPFAKILYGWIAAFMIITKVVRQNSSKVIFSKQELFWFVAEEEREEGFKQFLDDKTYKPGLGMYQRSRKK